MGAISAMRAYIHNTFNPPQPVYAETVAKSVPVARIGDQTQFGERSEMGMIIANAKASRQPFRDPALPSSALAGPAPSVASRHYGYGYQELPPTHEQLEAGEPFAGLDVETAPQRVAASRAHREALLGDALRPTAGEQWRLSQRTDFPEGGRLAPNDNAGRELADVGKVRDTVPGAMRARHKRRTSGAEADSGRLSAAFPGRGIRPTRTAYGAPPSPLWNESKHCYENPILVPGGWSFPSLQPRVQKSAPETFSQAVSRLCAGG